MARYLAFCIYNQQFPLSGTWDYTFWTCGDYSNGSGEDSGGVTISGQPGSMSTSTDPDAATPPSFTITVSDPDNVLDIDESIFVWYGTPNIPYYGQLTLPTSSPPGPGAPPC